MSCYYHICVCLLVLVYTSGFLRHNNVYTSGFLRHNNVYSRSSKIRVPTLSLIKATLIDDSSSTVGLIYGPNGEDLVWNNLRRDAKSGTVQYYCYHVIV